MEEIPQASLEEDLPYDLNQPVIAIKPEDYGVWYIDCMDQPERVCGKDRGVYGDGSQVAQIPQGSVCSGPDGHDLLRGGYDLPGLLVQVEGRGRPFRTKDWVRVQAEIGVEYQKDYRGEGPVLYAKKVERAKEIKDIVQF